MLKFAGQHFAILGAGRSGLGAARLARVHGAEVTVVDEGEPEKMQAALDKQQGILTLSSSAPAWMPDGRCRKNSPMRECP
jgi:UDP-N-acetylmuramoylalanine--D-glutamate ligase